jgi:hypothetical protein
VIGAIVYVAGASAAILGAPANIQATVAIRDIPNGYYTVRLAQGLTDCHAID